MQFNLANEDTFIELVDLDGQSVKLVADGCTFRVRLPSAARHMRITMSTRLTELSRADLKDLVTATLRSAVKELTTGESSCSSSN